MKSVLILLSLFISMESFSQYCSEANSLVSVRKRKAGSTEYVIFNLKNPATTTSEVTDATPPFTADGSGNTVNVTGCKFKRVKFSSITWTCQTRLNLSSSTSLIRQVKRLGQFEGQIEYIIGYRCNAQNIVSYSYDDGDLKKFVVRFKR